MFPLSFLFDDYIECFIIGARFNASQDQDSVLVKLREPLSPTTPRTRFERDFGFSMSGLGFTPHRHEVRDRYIFTIIVDL